MIGGDAARGPCCSTDAGWTSARIAEAFRLREDKVRLWRSDVMRRLVVHASPATRSRNLVDHRDETEGVWQDHEGLISPIKPSPMPSNVMGQSARPQLHAIIIQERMALPLASQ